MKKYILLSFTFIFILFITIFGITKIGKAQASASAPLNLSMYIWTTDLNIYSTDYIEKYLIKNNIKTAIISSNKKSEFKTLLKRLPRRGIKVEILIGSNSLLFNTNIPLYFDKLLKDIPLENISALHIDVEQYASSSFPDYKDNKTYYDNLYVDMLGKIKDYAKQKNLKVIVDIPAFYDTSMLQKIYAKADGVYVMAYQVSNASSLPAKLADEFTQNKEITTTALRAKDFAKRSDFETYLYNASTKLNTKNFALHALKDFVALDVK